MPGDHRLARAERAAQKRTLLAVRRKAEAVLDRLARDLAVFGCAEVTVEVGGLEWTVRAEEVGDAP